MTVNKNDNLDESKKTQSKNLLIGFSLLASAIYLINVLTRPDISQDIQGFLVVIIGLLIIVAIDFLKKDANTTNYDVKIPYSKIETHHHYNYTGSTIYQNSGNTHYSSDKNLEEVAAEIKKIIETVSQNTTDSDIKDIPILEAKLIEEIKHNVPETTKNLTNKDLSIAAKTIETIEQDKPLKQRVIDAAKVGTLAAFADILDHPYLSIIEAFAKDWTESETDINNSDIKSQNKNSE
ncbi:MAG: hypothetical protein QNJ37_16260 [Crocosphaera sp.]|nr:hypothetical protein [Crocosphaera sp.]